MTDEAMNTTGMSEEEIRRAWTGPVYRGPLRCSRCGEELTQENLPIHQECARQLMRELRDPEGR